MRNHLFLTLLSFATATGALASAGKDTAVTAAVPAAGAIARTQSKTPLQQPGMVELRCPLSSGFARRVNLSTGNGSLWRMTETSTGFAQSPPAVADKDVPPAWAVAFTNAKWVKAKAAGSAAFGPGQYVFSNAFRIMPSAGEMRVMLKGSVLADEQFSVELIEAGPGAPSQGGSNADAPNPGQLTPRDSYDIDMLVGEALFQSQPSGSKNPRSGDYQLNITVENTAPYSAAVAAIAQLELSQTCLTRGGGVRPIKKQERR